MPFSNPLHSITIPAGAGPNDYRIFIGPDIPQSLTDNQFLGAIIFYTPSGSYFFIAIKQDPVTLQGEMVAGYYDISVLYITYLTEWLNLSNGSGGFVQGVQFVERGIRMWQRGIFSSIGINPPAVLELDQGMIVAKATADVDINQPVPKPTYAQEWGRGKLAATSNIFTPVGNSGTVTTTSIVTIPDSGTNLIYIPNFCFVPDRVYRVRIEGQLYCASTASYRSSVYFKIGNSGPDNIVHQYYNAFGASYSTVHSSLLVGFSSTSNSPTSQMNYYKNIYLRGSVSTLGKAMAFLSGFKFYVEDVGNYGEWAPLLDVAVVSSW